MIKNIILGLSICIFCSCKKDDTSVDNTPGQNVSVLVKPNQTDNSYPSADESHYVVRNTKTHLNKLFLFIGGSYSTPKNYNLVCDNASTIGLDVISLSYPNNIATAPLGTSSDQYIFDNYRQEICFGSPVSNVVNVDTLNSIATRTIKLLQFLKTAYPDQNWGQYLTSSGSLQWSKIIISGHSQGSGHACYLGKKNLVDRIVMFSGPNDYSTNFNASANWLFQTSQTPTNKYFGLLHTQDEIVPFNYQVANFRALGLLTTSQMPTLVDNLTAPYGNANTMSLNVSALSYHNSTIGANSILPAIWTYMLTRN
jgi:hypothetical protein